MLKRELSILTLLVLLCLHDVKAENLITCGGLTASLTCAQGTIKVLSANYGRTSRTTCSARKPPRQIANVRCTQSTSLSVLSTLCDGKQNCSIVVGNAAFTEPCPGTYKYLNVSYECILPTTPPPPPPPSSTNNSVTCESDTASLSCAKGSIKVLSANYGRMNQITCSTGKPANQLSNDRCTQNTSQSVVFSRCDGKQDCSIPATNNVFIDPCVGTYKYLNVSYVCAEGKTVIICQDRSSTISCEGRRKLNIHFANYGRRDKVTCPNGNNEAICISSETSKLQTKCNGKRSCQLRASNSNFKNRCPDIHKYLEVSYSCE
ncbi:L-rhamnose-binding lectin CSL2-like [Triplophysa dalaica]|uniref:L-rhamnose-binding lectin CSL2-like n=1 Tax=Triplophysa dalaica TaxID=1582913 RepID=UPI0024E01407|nr:L-rhamnose-binding lectin CSL2-like [Triplophysa dalaica]